MNRNFARITNYYNRKEAWSDWYKLAAEVEREGCRDLLTKHAPPMNAGWRTIDKRIAKLRKEFEELLRTERFLELVETCLTDPAHIAFAAEPQEGEPDLYGGWDEKLVTIRHKPKPAIWCDNCQCWVNPSDLKTWTGDDARHHLCPGCDTDLLEPERME